MKSKKSIVLCATLALAGVVPVFAAGEAVDGRPRKPVAREAAGQGASGAPARAADPLPLGRGLTAQIVYQVLLAEVALQRGRGDFASQAYTDLALRTRDPALLERAIEVAGIARRLDLVLELARQWIQVEPDSKRAQQVLAGVMIMSNQFDGLAPQLISMLEADRPALPGNLLGLNRMLARSPDRQAVYQLISRVCAPFLDLPEAHYALAVAASSAGENERALAAARKANELRPDWEPAVLVEAELLARRSPAEAIARLQAFVDAYPMARDVRLFLARALVGEKRYADAKRQFERLLIAYPNNPDVVFPVAVLALQEDDRVLAEAQLKHLVTLDIPDKSTAYYYLGQLAQDGKRPDEALSHFRQVRTGEHVVPSVVRSAAILSSQGKIDEARRLLQDAASANPQQRVRLLIAEAAVLREDKQYAAALELLDNELAAQPDEPDLLYESALLAEKLDRLELMESRLRKLIELQPENAQAYNALGYSYAERNLRLPEARQLIEKALQLAPDDPFILDSMGWVLYRQGDHASALTLLLKAYGQRSDPEIAAHVGEVLWTLGRYDEARRTLREAQTKHPGNDVLSEAVRKFAQ
ncbi:MAG TPA: tetratricopeptide repeat protein [Accumulibacter sp.]|uniref:tetratricopeptide repeat protein n=1 Tax=Accumulibacter sp. TaxID=2053492 RepID=UPI002C15A662|nr:tetratricopeptide repeat protein [Accumulibacter sp.]HMV04960.1 tetratricopeptide repeat protein [Accumulibacter sp.]HMW79110.1 tetratricopeptide repeat protein [Accumulibacter sp.]HNG87350.1 tetratricopeptide repeat protein [Accumulibacter sp.]HNH91036.1 tetratricopeptide repeat protein [Accumulibacter sp.]HNI51060.1 tetratricopeptide repeat protein [Accumulibacter sp.]